MKVPKPKKTKVSYEEARDKIGDKYDFLSDGRDAQVYAKSRLRVIKIWAPYYVKSIEADPYVQFLKAIPKGNPYFPTIYSIQLFKHRDGDYGIVELERLQELYDCEYDEYENEVDKFTSGAINAMLGDFGKRPVPKHYDQIDHLLEVLKGIFYGGRVRPKTKVATQVVEAIKKMRKSNATVDIHDGNVMLRKSGRKRHMVIIDPLC